MEKSDHIKMQLLECEGLDIAATLECDSTDEHPIYHPSNMLLYMVQGQFNLKLDNQLYIIQEGNFCLIRKYTHGKCFKTWKPEQDGARMIAFALQDEYIKSLLPEKLEDLDDQREQQLVVPLPDTKLLKGLIGSLSEYFEGDEEVLDRQIVQIKTAEALHALIKAKPETIQVFREFSIPERANLVDFMNHNFQYNFPLERFAQMSGRSLSTFNRDFKKIFQESPHKWLVKRRLQMARQLIQGGKSASDVYLDVGFEDLAHFSKRFKSFFGINPSEVARLAV